MVKMLNLRFHLKCIKLGPKCNDYLHLIIFLDAYIFIMTRVMLEIKPLTLTKLIRMVHILVSSYTASNPWLTD